jgi:uncharacterized membrane-anchored protein YhcB (DUF1043 family)
MFVNGPDNAMLIIGLVSVGLIIGILILRYILRKIFNKVEDTIENKLADRKNAASANKEENLSDRYK